MLVIFGIGFVIQKPFGKRTCIQFSRNSFLYISIRHAVFTLMYFFNAAIDESNFRLAYVYF